MYKSNILLLNKHYKEKNIIQNLATYKKQQFCSKKKNLNFGKKNKMNPITIQNPLGLMHVENILHYEIVCL